MFEWAAKNGWNESELQPEEDEDEDEAMFEIKEEIAIAFHSKF